MNQPVKPWPTMSIAEAHKLLTAPGSPFEMDEAVIRGVKTRVWKNAPPTIRDLFALGRAHGDKIFLVHEDDRSTFKTFSRAALAVAAELTRQGVKKGDRVALIMRNLPEWPAIFFGATIIGAIVTPLNAWWTGPELEYGLVDSGSKVAFVDAERLERIAEHLVNCPDLKTIYVSRYQDELPHPIVRRLEDTLGKVNDWGMLPAGELPATPLLPDDDATILYTSGTTGKPKGALGTHRNMLSNIFASASAAAGSRTSSMNSAANASTSFCGTTIPRSSSSTRWRRRKCSRSSSMKKNIRWISRWPKTNCRRRSDAAVRTCVWPASLRAGSST